MLGCLEGQIYFGTWFFRCSGRSGLGDRAVGLPIGSVGQEAMGQASAYWGDGDGLSGCRQIGLCQHSSQSPSCHRKSISTGTQRPTFCDGPYPHVPNFPSLLVAQQAEFHLWAMFGTSVLKQFVFKNCYISEIIPYSRDGECSPPSLP